MFFQAEELKKEKHLKKQRSEKLEEELGVHIKVGNLIAKLEFKGTEYYFNAHIIGGVFGSGKAEEFELKGRGSYIPLWLPIHELEKVNIKPYEVVESILEHYKI